MAPVLCFVMFVMLCLEKRNKHNFPQKTMFALTHGFVGKTMQNTEIAIKMTDL